MASNLTNPFIAQTASDYAMTYEEVESIYNQYFHEPGNIFYDKLEEFIAERANTNNAKDDDLDDLIREEKIERLTNDLRKFISERVKHEDCVREIMSEFWEYEDQKAEILNEKQSDSWHRTI